MLEYNKKYVEIVLPVVLERVEIKNKIYAVNYHRINKVLSCLIGWLVLDVVYENNEGYLIVKKIK